MGSRRIPGRPATPRLAEPDVVDGAQLGQPNTFMRGLRFPRLILAARVSQEVHDGAAGSMKTASTEMARYNGESRQQSMGPGSGRSRAAEWVSSRRWRRGGGERVRQGRPSAGRRRCQGTGSRLAPRAPSTRWGHSIRNSRIASLSATSPRTAASRCATPRACLRAPRLCRP